MKPIDRNFNIWQRSSFSIFHIFLLSDLKKVLKVKPVLSEPVTVVSLSFVFKAIVL